MRASIEVKNLTKTYGALTAVDDISFTVGVGETFGMLGPNGAGKTTTLEMIEGLKQPTAGSIRVEGLDVATQAPAVKSIIGVQLQASTFFENLRLDELIHTFAALYNRRIDATALLADVQLAEKARSKPRELSGGQKQRLSIAIALVNDPKVLFLDEPTTGLDPQARRNLWELIKQIKAKGKTVVLTTHYIEEAQVLCDRVAIMDHAHIVAIDSPANLLKTSGIDSRVEFTAERDLPEVALGSLTGVVNLERAGHTFCATTTDPQATLDGLYSLARAGGIQLDNLSVRRATLEDVFS